MAENADLIKLANKLVTDGPYKCEQTSRRVRALFNGIYLFDTIDAYYVWEHPHYPQFYIPARSLHASTILTKNSPAIEGADGIAHLATLTSSTPNPKTITRAILFNTTSLPDLLRIEFRALDQWFEESIPINIHPKDPYKRISILPSSRNVRIELDHVKLAETRSPVLLFETGLRTRYYLPMTDVNWGVLAKSDTVTGCPYKGNAEYWSIDVKGKRVRDAVWSYRFPTMESAGIAGLVCFYDEKVDVWVDGVLQDK